MPTTDLSLLSGDGRATRAGPNLCGERAEADCYSITHPRRAARATASVRDSAPSLARMALTWYFHGVLA